MCTVPILDLLDVIWSVNVTTLLIAIALLCTFIYNEVTAHFGDYQPLFINDLPYGDRDDFNENVQWDSNFTKHSYELLTLIFEENAAIMTKAYVLNAMKPNTQYKTEKLRKEEDNLDKDDFNTEQDISKSEVMIKHGKIEQNIVIDKKHSFQIDKNFGRTAVITKSDNIWECSEAGENAKHDAAMEKGIAEKHDATKVNGDVTEVDDVIQNKDLQMIKAVEKFPDDESKANNFVSKVNIIPTYNKRPESPERVMKRELSVSMLNFSMSCEGHEQRQHGENLDSRTPEIECSTNGEEIDVQNDFRQNNQNHPEESVPNDKPEDVCPAANYEVKQVHANSAENDIDKDSSKADPENYSENGRNESLETSEVVGKENVTELKVRKRKFLIEKTESGLKVTNSN